jgi:hypothetical protein
MNRIARIVTRDAPPGPSLLMNAKRIRICENTVPRVVIFVDKKLRKTRRRKKRIVPSFALIIMNRASFGRIKVNVLPT